MDEKPIQIDVDKILASKLPKGRKLPAFIVKYLKRILHQNDVNGFLREYSHCKGISFATACISNLLNVTYNAIDKENIDSSKRYIFVSNHPLGGLDGMVLLDFLGGIFDNNVKAQVNDVLLAIEPLAPAFIPVNKYGKQSRELSKNLTEILESDTQILVFPAGLCSRKQGGKIADLEWKKWFVTNAIQYKRDVIPIYFDGKNSNFFYRFAQFRKKIGLKFNIELIYLPDEMFRTKNKRFNIHIGAAIPWQTFDKSKTPKGWAAHVKDIVYNLKENKKR